MAKKIIDINENNESKKPSSRAATTVIIAIIVIITALALAVVLWMQQRNSQPAETKQETTPSSAIENAIKAEEGANEAELQEALNKNPSNSERQQLLQLLANEAYTKGDFQAAVTYLRQAFEAGTTAYGIPQGIGTIYFDKLNDKPQALKYFKEARRLAEVQKSQDPIVEQDIHYLNEKIKELEGQGVAPAS